MEKLLEVNFNKDKMIQQQYLKNILIKSAEMELLFWIFLDALMNFITFKFAIQKVRIMLSQEFIIKDFQTDYQRITNNMDPIQRNDLLFNQKIWLNKNKKWIHFYLFYMVKSFMKELKC